MKCVFFTLCMSCSYLKHCLKFIFINNPSCLAWFFILSVFKSVRKIINVSCNTLLQRCSFIKNSPFFTTQCMSVCEGNFSCLLQEPRGGICFYCFRSFVLCIAVKNEDQHRNLLINQMWKSPNFIAWNSRRFLLDSVGNHAESEFESAIWSIIKIAAHFHQIFSMENYHNL